MEFTKIERRRIELKAYANAIKCLNNELNYELNVISGKYNWPTERDIETAKIRCETLNTIINNLENEALK